MPYNPFSVPEFMNFHILTRMITECSIVRYNKSCLFFFFFLYCTVFEYDKLRTRFLIKHALSTSKCSLLRITHAWMVFYVGIVNNNFFYLQCKNVGRESRQTVHNGWSWVASLLIFMPRSLLADRFHDTWRDTPEQIGSSSWWYCMECY